LRVIAIELQRSGFGSSFLEPSLPSAVRKIFVMLWVVLPLAAQPIASQKSCEFTKFAQN